MALAPNLFAFISAAYAAGRATSGKLPEWYETSGAIETAVFVGSGASFTVRRQRTSSRPQTFHQAIDGLQISHTQKSSSKPKYIAYKTVNVKFKPSGEPIQAEDRLVLSNALQELLAITHEPILQHPNIVDFLGLAWIDIQDSQHVAPVLAVEYADYGSLAALQESASARLTTEEKELLAVDIGLGLQALHGCGIVHGDIKPDNVLVFDGTTRSRRYLAKLADFGSAILGHDWPSSLLGTFLWSAPELSSRKVSLPRETDIFSYGLTVWSIYIGGRSPLQAFALAKYGKKDSHTVSDLKASEHLIDYAKAQDLSPAKGFFDVTLALDPQKRDLSMAIDYLASEVGRSEVNSEFTRLADTHAYHSCRQAEIPISWGVASWLDQRVQKALVTGLEAMAMDVVRPNMIKPSLLFGLAPMKCDGLGGPMDLTGSIANIMKVATFANHQGARSIAYRVCKTFDNMSAIDAVGQPQGVDWLYSSASRGSWAAQEDLRQLDLTKYEEAMALLKNRYCGVGANFFADDQFIEDWKYEDFLQLPTFLQIMKRRYGSCSLDKVSTVQINRRGDGLLHIAASCGLLSLLKWLIALFPGLIDQVNPLGETPLFHACRAGQVDTARLLLSKGADASVGPPDGVGNVHWLVNFKDELVSELLTLLKKNGADIEACALRPLDYVCYGFEVRFAYGEVFCRGTPMHWAVCKNRPNLMEELITQGALFHPSMFPKGFKTKEKDVPPNYLSSMLHHYECLEVLITEFNKWRAGFTFGPLFCQFIAGGSLFSRVVRHGPSYEMFTRKTLEYLTSASMRGTFFGGPDGQGNTLLTLAIQGGFEDVAIMILDFPRWRAELNSPGGPSAMTPFHLAAHRNMTKLIPVSLASGADPTTRGHRLSLLGARVWSALHYFASANHPASSSVLPILLDTNPLECDDAESPLAVAVDSNNYALAEYLLSLSPPADINALSTSGAIGHYIFAAPTTILGRLIKANAANTVLRLHFLFRYAHLVNFVVTPSMNFTALHEAARLNIGTRTLDLVGDTEVIAALDVRDIDMLSHREIWLTLLQHFRGPQYLDAQVEHSNDTALHWAVIAANDVGVEALLEAGASVSMVNREGLTPLAFAQRIVSNWSEPKEGPAWPRTLQILEMLEDA